MKIDLPYKKILIIIRRSHGDVLVTSALTKALHDALPDVRIDLLVNDDTLGTAKAVPFVDTIHCFSYKWAKAGLLNRIHQELRLIRNIFRQYDLSLALTANERSNIYAFLAGKTVVGAETITASPFGWKKLLFTNTYPFRLDRHIIYNNLHPLQLLNIPINDIKVQVKYSPEATERVRRMLTEHSISRFIIFHPSARYMHKIYPRHLRNRLLQDLNTLDIPIVVTGGPSSIDLQVAAELPNLKNIYDFTNRTTIDECIALTDLAMGYIGMDTLNVHIAAALEKRIFLISGPTRLSLWSPWSNQMQTNAKKDQPIQTYGNITIFQANLPCVACGLAGCDDRDGESRCMNHIPAGDIFSEVRQWLDRGGNTKTTKAS